MSMSGEELWEIAFKRTDYALAKIANHQMNTWTKYPSGDTPRDIIAGQMVEAMNDAQRNSPDNS